MKTCSRCQVAQPFDNFSSRGPGRTRQSHCKQCRSAYARAHHVANRDAELSRKATWRAANAAHAEAATAAWRLANAEREREGKRLREARRRATLRGNPTLPFTSEQLRARLSMFDGCWVCEGVPTQVDHVKPIARGGGHILANLRPICGPCNQRKKDRWPLVTQDAVA